MTQNTPNIIVPGPEGYRRTDAGLLVPEGMPEGRNSSLEDRTNSGLSETNQELVKLKETLKTNSLFNSIYEAYLNYSRYTDSNGVIMYKTDFTAEDGGRLTKEITDALKYHLHHRYFNFADNEKLLVELEQIKGPYGESYLDAMVRTRFPVEEKVLTKMFTGSINGNTIAAIGNQLVTMFEENETARLMGDRYKNDPNKIAEGLSNLNNVYKIAELDPQQFARMHPEELTKTYLKLLAKVWENQARSLRN